MADKSKQSNWFKRHKVLTGLLVIIVLIIAGSSAGKKSDSTTNTTNNTKSSSSSTTTSSSPKTETPKVPAEYKSALAQADSYANNLHLSKQGVYDQLVSDYGGKFSAAAAQYAIDNVKADWNANALAQAKTYQNDLHLSPTAVHDQLVSDSGGKFTQSEADYALQHLND